MRRGGGIGYDFSRLRPRGDRIKSLDSKASGAISFMGIFDAVCQPLRHLVTGVERKWVFFALSDIEEFITAKTTATSLQDSTSPSV